MKRLRARAAFYEPRIDGCAVPVLAADTSGVQGEEDSNCSMNRVVHSASPPARAMVFSPPRAGFFFSVRRACATAWGCESPAQPDGGEGLAKRKGVVVRRGLKEARSKATT